MIGTHGTNQSRGVMILFKPKLDVNIEQIICDKNGMLDISLLKHW